jgi:glc operon protein GlcG
VAGDGVRTATPRESGAVGLGAARECIARGIRKAEELGFKVAVAVVDAAGHLVACERMDGALWVTPEIARAKANAAAGFRTTTRDLEERFTARQLFAAGVTALPGYDFVFGKGGVPLVADGSVIGAVGVSGAVPAENDHTIADAAAGHPEVPRSH